MVSLWIVAVILVLTSLRPAALGDRNHQTRPAIYFADVDDFYKSNPFEYNCKGAAQLGTSCLEILLTKRQGCGQHTGQVREIDHSR